MGKSKEIVWYDWVGPSGYEDNTHILKYDTLAVTALTEPVIRAKQRIILSGRCNCSSSVAVSR